MPTIKSSRQRNTPLSAQEAEERLLANGLTLISDHRAGTVTTTTSVEVSCAAGHRMRRLYGDIRQRGCPQCDAPFGERLLFALLRHYADGVDDWKKKTVKGLDPDDPELRVVFDAASESRRVAIENHSEYHLANSHVPLFSSNISKEKRLYLDSLKVPSNSNGLHVNGPLAGWKAGVVWFEATRLRKLASQHGLYLPYAVKEFKALAKSLALPLRLNVHEITAQEVFVALGKDKLTDVKPGFSLLGEWHGRAHEHLWQHTCGGRFSAPVTSVENNVLDRTGCPFCDRKGRPGAWLDFLDRVAAKGYELAKQHRMEVITEYQPVPLRCIAHPDSEVKRFTRSKLYQWLGSLSDVSPVSMLPPCRTCASLHAKRIAKSEADRLRFERDKLGVRLKNYGFVMVTHLATSFLDPVVGKVRAQKNVIQCLNCKHQRSVFVTQTLQKADMRGSIGCPACRATPRGPKKRGA